MEEIISDIAFKLHTLKEDKPYLILTDDIIKGFVEEEIDKIDIDKIVELVKNELEEL